MMSVEIIDLPPILDAITPEKGNGRRYSMGQTRVSVDGKKSVPHYLRASTGSCHDLCKYGRRHENETKPWSSACRRKKIEGKLPVKIFTGVEVLPDRKNYLKAKPKSSTDGKGRLPDSSGDSKHKVSTYEKRTLQSNEGKSKAASALKSSAVPTRLSNPGTTIKEQISPEIEDSKMVSVKVTEIGMPGKSGTHSRTEAAIPKLTPSSKSPQTLCLRKEDRKVVENTRIPDRIRVKNAVISSTSSMPSKSSVVSTQTSIKRQVQKTVIGQRNQKIAEDRGIQRIEVEVLEKTLYIIDVETKDKSMNFDESNIDMGVPSPSPSPSLSVAESSALQDSSAILSHSEGKEETEKSNIQYSSQEDGDDGDDDDEGLEYPDDESEVYFNLKLDENENVEKEVISVGRSVESRPRKEGTVHPEGMNSDPVKLRFRRGRVVEIKSEDNAPQRLKFRRCRLLGENEARTGAQRRRLKKRDNTDGNDGISDPSSEKYALRQSSVQGKKNAQGLFNNVIEETASKLVENRISKVKALVGAFETVISLQDGKPSATD